MNKFKDLEWSGPAWYQVETDKDGFPVSWKILHFHPLNLGGHAATEWEAKDLAKILGDTYRKFPKLKKAFTGLIHSHNTMGAFLSGTDTTTLETMAPDKNFYGSLVVASSGKELHAFGFSWKDQYKCAHTFILDEIDIEVQDKINIDSNWVEIADKIEKEKPKAVPGKQINAFGTGVNPQQNTYMIEYKRKNIIASKTQKTQKEINKLIDLNTEGKLSDVDLELKLETLGLDVTEIILLMEDTSSYTNHPYGGYNGYGY